MFTKEDVIKVLDKLKKSYPCFVSEAHFQMIFAIEAKNQKKDKFEFYTGTSSLSNRLEESSRSLRMNSSSRKIRDRNNCIDSMHGLLLRCSPCT